MKKRARLISLLLALVFSLTFYALSGCSDNNAKVSKYQIEATLNENVLSGKERVVFYNSSENAFSVLKFNLYPNAYREGAKYSPISNQYKTRAYYNGINYGAIEINGVCDERGNALEFEICGEDKNILSVTLPQTVYPDESICVIIDFSTVIAQVISRLGITAQSINLANFYPILCGLYNDAFYECVYYSVGDPFFSDASDYEVSLCVDESYVVASSGKLVGSSVKDGKKTLSYTAKNLRSFACVLSQNFDIVTKNYDNIEINYYFYKDQTPEKSLDTANKSISYFQETFGTYPFETYAVVQTPFLQGGMEFSGLVMISDNLEREAYDEVIIHETAHQWWQAGVGNNEIEHPFLDEGLTEYSVVLFYENHSEYGFTREQLIKSSEQTYKMYCSVYEKLFNRVDTTMLRPIGEFNGEYEYVNLCYVKPCIMFDYLRTSIGDAKFFKALKKYYSDFTYKNACPDDLVGAFEKCGNNTNGFFESFFEGKVII